MLAHQVEHRLIDVDCCFKFQNDLRRAVIGERVHLFQALDILQFKLCRPDKKTLAVFRRYARQGQCDRDKRRGDIRIAFARYGLISG